MNRKTGFFRMPRKARVMLGVLCVIAALGLCACGSTHRYDWDGLVDVNGRYQYYEGGQLVSKLGVDVSDHQGSIDWDAVADDGIEFAFIRIGRRGYTEGALYMDERYVENMHGAQAADIPVGVYFFSQALNEDEALEEARFVIDVLDGRSLDLPVVFDQEPVSDEQGRANGLSTQQLTANVQVFCAALEDAGYTTMFYANSKDSANLKMKKLLRSYDFWYAEYDSLPSTDARFALWQYTNGGQVAGISTYVDLNLMFRDAADWSSLE